MTLAQQQFFNLLGWVYRSAFCSSRFCFLLKVYLIFALLGYSFTFAKSGEVFKLIEATKIKKYEDITFVLRLPYRKSVDERISFVDSKSFKVRGVLAICTWTSEPEEIELNVTKKFPHLVGFADRNNLALVSWTNFKGYRINVSGDEMDEEGSKQYEKDYDQRAREWRHGFRRLCRKYILPEDNTLMYGLSGGGQMAHRLALRMPEHFFAVHIHVNSSYDRVRRGGEQVLWLVTTGMREFGYPAGVRFYREALQNGYHMIFRAEENLGHRGSPDTTRTSLAFFEYCLKFLPDASDPKWQPPPIDQFYLMRYPTYIGDYLNGEAFKREVANDYMEPEVMVALPTREIAEAWGTVFNIKE